MQNYQSEEEVLQAKKDDQASCGRGRGDRGCGQQPLI